LDGMFDFFFHGLVVVAFCVFRFVEGKLFFRCHFPISNPGPWNGCSPDSIPPGTRYGPLCHERLVSFQVLLVIAGTASFFHPPPAPKRRGFRGGLSVLSGPHTFISLSPFLFPPVCDNGVNKALRQTPPPTPPFFSVDRKTTRQDSSGRTAFYNQHPSCPKVCFAFPCSLPFELRFSKLNGSSFLPHSLTSNPNREFFLNDRFLPPPPGISPSVITLHPLPMP